MVGDAFGVGGGHGGELFGFADCSWRLSCVSQRER